MSQIGINGISEVQVQIDNDILQTKIAWRVGLIALTAAANACPVSGLSPSLKASIGQGPKMGIFNNPEAIALFSCPQNANGNPWSIKLGNVQGQLW